MRRTRSRRLSAVSAAAVLVGGLSLAACGDDGGEEDLSFNEDGTEQPDEGDSGDSGDTEETEASENTSDSGDSEDSGESEGGDTVTDEGSGSGDTGMGSIDEDQVREQAVQMYQDMLGLDAEQSECLVDEMFGDMNMDEMAEMEAPDTSQMQEWLESCGIDPGDLQSGS